MRIGEVNALRKKLEKEMTGLQQPTELAEVILSDSDEPEKTVKDVRSSKSKGKRPSPPFPHPRANF